jgi:hypothetical protein
MGWRSGFLGRSWFAEGGKVRVRWRLRWWVCGLEGRELRGVWYEWKGVVLSYLIDAVRLTK